MLCRSCLNTWICIRRIFIANILHIFVLKVQATFTGFSGDVPFGPLQLVFTAGYCARTFCCNRIRTHETMPSQYKSFLGRGVPSCIHFQAHAIVYFTYYIYIYVYYLYIDIYTHILLYRYAQWHLPTLKSFVTWTARLSQQRFTPNRFAWRAPFSGSTVSALRRDVRPRTHLSCFSKPGCAMKYHEHKPDIWNPCKSQE